MGRASSRNTTTVTVDACEDAVGTSVKKMRGKLVKRVQFMSDQRETWQASSAETGVKGWASTRDLAVAAFVQHGLLCGAGQRNHRFSSTF